MKTMKDEFSLMFSKENKLLVVFVKSFWNAILFDIKISRLTLIPLQLLMIEINLMLWMFIVFWLNVVYVYSCNEYEMHLFLFLLLNFNTY